MRIGNSRYWSKVLHYPNDNRRSICYSTIYLVLYPYKPIYPRVIILLIPLAIIPDRELKHDLSFARVYAIHHLVAFLLCLALPLLLVSVRVTHTALGELVLTSCRHTRPATRALRKSH